MKFVEFFKVGFNVILLREFCELMFLNSSRKFREDSCRFFKAYLIDFSSIKFV